jgi:acyl-CoA thioesterase-1
MSPFVMRFADGSVFFLGLALVLFALFLRGFSHRRWVVSVWNLSAVVGMLCVFLSANPQPLFAYILWGLSALGTLVVVKTPGAKQWGRGAAWALLLLGTAYLGIAEARHHRRPHFSMPVDTPVYVIGDSISAGTGVATRCWPEMLADIGGIPVTNLAQPGATVEDALRQAARIAHPRAVVIVEIGGNDLLGETDSATFRQRLRELIHGLRTAGHDVLLMEIPLYPFQNAFGDAQRAVAEQEGAELIPKRFFARVLETPDGTIDGLHLSPVGHRAMADLFADLLLGKR